jgi:uncharacterized protein
MYLRIHENGGQRVVAVCDEELIGKALSDGKTYLDLEAHRGFYVGEKADAAGVKKALASFTSANLVGKNAVKVALGMDLASNDDVMYINRIPYIQIYKI